MSKEKHTHGGAMHGEHYHMSGQGGLEKTDGEHYHMVGKGEEKSGGMPYEMANVKK